jgi:hypothetical protein
MTMERTNSTSSGGQQLALRLRTARRLLFLRRHADHLPRLDPVARRGALAVQPQLSRPRPASDGAEARLGQVALEPAVEADAVILVADDELADLLGGAHAVAFASQRPAKSRTSAPITDDRI